MRRNDDTTMLEKVMLILQTFRTASGPQRLADIARSTHLPKSTVHRLIQPLLDLNLLQRVEGGFALGLVLFELGELVPVKSQLRQAALPFMQDLFAATHQTVHLGVRDGCDVVYAEKIHGHGGVDLPSRIGGRLPLTCTGIGKALLAFALPDVVDEVLGQPLRRLTPHSITDLDLLKDEVSRVQTAGVAYDREEAAVGGCCVAAPVLVNGVAIAALSVSVPVAQFHPARLGPAVRTAALGLSRKLNRLW